MNSLRKLFGNKKNLVILWPILVIFAKIIRYTILKKTLVDAGIGYKMLPYIVSHSSVFQLFDADTSSGAVGNAGCFFEKINIFNLTSYEAFEVQITIVWNLIIVGMISKCKYRFNSGETLFLVLSILALNIFDFTLAKEPVQILFFVLIFYNMYYKRYKTEMYYLITSSIVIALSVVTFRNYYILLLAWTICIFFIFHFLEEKKMTFRRIIILIIGVSCFYLAMMYAVKILSPLTYQELIRVRTRASSATTEIKSIIGSENLALFTLNYILVIFRMLFPIELIRFGAKCAIYVGVQLVISAVVIKALLNIRKLEVNERVALYIILGFILMSGFFEPDFGSWIRHEIAIFPMFLVAGQYLNPAKNTTKKHLKNRKW